MWYRWFPWRFIVRRVALKRGFFDPISLMSRLSRFAQPSEVAVPIEVLRIGAVLQARGLINSQAIQHNLDWIWPYWVEKQFNPRSESFVPRAFSLTHINLTHRNWTAVGIPGLKEFPLIDPRGLVTPFFDGWSLDAWLITDESQLIPSRCPKSSQRLHIDEGLYVTTESVWSDLEIRSRVQVTVKEDRPVCSVQWQARSSRKGWFIVSLRPYNPEGVSFIHQIKYYPGEKRWLINNKHSLYFTVPFDAHVFSTYREGDVYHHLFDKESRLRANCEVGMATAAGIFEIDPSRIRQIGVDVPLAKKPGKFNRSSAKTKYLSFNWTESFKNTCRLNVPDEKFQFLFDAALRTILLHTPDEVYPGPYTYRHFWFRDAAFILQAMLSCGFHDVAERVIDISITRQKPNGYFESQEGEWDSNGQVLWAIERFCELTGRPPRVQWKDAIRRAAEWIQKKRVSRKLDLPHAGLLPSGFSAEHLGPSDYYYWDDFWGVAGLRAAGYLLDRLGQTRRAENFVQEAGSLMYSIEKSLQKASFRLKSNAMPASPYRRMDSGAIGSIAAGYPLQLWDGKDERIKETLEYLLHHCCVSGGFFHDMSHSGINPYLTLHIAQALLRAGDARYLDLMNVVADLASPTGQWPEAVHPRTRGGCMGDGEHVWAVAEWVMMIRNCFIRGERARNKLILLAGIPPQWFKSPGKFSLGPVWTSYGKAEIKAESDGRCVRVHFKREWHGISPAVEIHLRGYPVRAVGETEETIEIPL
ncbi:MAG: hypothetical protein JXD21_08545 [Candidatus Omnitrophica bacterium]|nr:hypothetical protein [Candidatus Omnitrophota bacterium]